MNWNDSDWTGDYINSIYKYDINFDDYTIVSNQWSHWDMWVNKDNEEIYVQFEFGSKAWIWWYNLDTGEVIKLLDSKYNWWHVSCRNYGLKDWCYLSTNQEWYKEVFALKLDDTKTVRRFGQTFQPSSSFWAPNPSWTKVIFKSSWNTGIEHTFISGVSK